MWRWQNMECRKQVTCEIGKRIKVFRITRQVLLLCVKQAPELLLGDVSDLDVYTAINLAMNKVEWKENRPSTFPPEG